MLNYSKDKLKKFNKIVEKSKKIVVEPQAMNITAAELRNHWKGSEENIANALALVSKSSELHQNMKPFDTQLLCALTLFDGNIAEMKTGEGKTLAAVIASFLFYCDKQQVFIISVNDYLTKRDALFAKQILEPLGVSCDYNISSSNYPQKQSAYKCDVVYITNHEIAFDYLRNNLVKNKANVLFNELPAAIIDEVDSVLIDEARNPFIISDKQDTPILNIQKADKFAKELSEGMYKIDHKRNAIILTDAGIKKAEKVFGIDNFASEKFGNYRGLIQNALDANYLKHEGTDYIIKNNEIVLIDLATGRIAPGKQYLNGLHQAIQAKEGLKIAPETKTTASIAYQFLFKLFKKISGMSGTAITDKEEFRAIYNLPVIEIPLRLPLLRIDHDDMLFSSAEERDEAVLNKIIELHKSGRPVLVGTASIAKSEELSAKLSKLKVNHNVLNAKQHEKESEIIAKAGEKNAITISTNMAGRGTDIVLGEGVKELGGLYVIGTERYEARRIDNQLRGRSGRQGDPGESQFFTSLEDKTIKAYGMEQLKPYLDTLKNLKKGAPLQSKIFSNIATSAQKQSEGINFDARKSTLKYSTLVNKQYYQLYDFRRKILIDDNFENFIVSIAKKVRQKDIENLIKSNFSSLSDMRKEHLRLSILEMIDHKWTTYIQDVDYIRTNAFFSSYRSSDPFAVFVEDCTKRYSDLLADIQNAILNNTTLELNNIS